MNFPLFSLAHDYLHSLVQAVKRHLRQWTRPDNHDLVLNSALDLTRSKSELLLENMLLRQQLIVLKRQAKRPALTWDDLTSPRFACLRTFFDISVYQGGDVLGGESIMFSDAFAQGKPVVLSLWAGLCPVCRIEMPELEQAYAEYGDRVLFIGLDVGPFVGLGSQEDGLASLDELGITYPAGITSDATISRAYRVLGSAGFH